MSLFRKLIILFGLLFVVVLSSTLSIVYYESRQTIVELSKQKAVALIQTIDSAMESQVPDAQFEQVLLHLKEKQPSIISFDIYKLNNFLYDIASTNPNQIGTQSNNQTLFAVSKNKTLSSLHGNVLEIIAPIQSSDGTYSANVKVSIAGDLTSSRKLLTIILVIGLCAILLAVLAVWFFTRQFLSKPLLTIVSAANDVAAGNLHIDLAESEKRRDEVGHLARSFRRMTQSLQELMGRVADTANELSREFDKLVQNGDYAARGALHASDSIEQVTQSVLHHVKSLGSLRSALDRCVLQVEHNIKTNSDTEPTWIYEDALEDLREISVKLEKEMTLAQNHADTLNWVLASENGQLGAMQHVNQTAAQLSQMASDLYQLIATYEI